MPELSEARVTIIGLGLMGGSLAAALKSRRAVRELVGVARRAETVAYAEGLRYIDWGTCNLPEGVEGADVVILAMPVRAILKLIPELGPYLKPGSLLLDLGSTKKAILEAMAGMPPHVQPVGGHPLCGKELSGIEAAEPELYEGANFVLIPLPRTAPEALRLAEELARACGAGPLVMTDAARHDRLLAVTSHLPYLLAAALVAAAEETEDEMTWQMAAGGFRDASRLAASDLDMMLDIFLTNQGPVQEALARFREQLEQMVALLFAGQEEKWRQAIKKIQQRRKEMWR
ncbi:MAG: prephenate dehydrogenase [Anaerolineae bacterium]